MDNHKKIVIIVALAVVVVVVAIILLAGGGSRTDDPKVTVTTDPDTGDEIVSVEGKDPEFDPGSAPVVLGGSKMLEQSSMTNTQYLLVVSIVTDYAIEHVGEDVSTIKFLPDTVKASAKLPNGTPYQYTVTVKTENPESLANVTINLIGLIIVRVKITNPDKPGSKAFDSGVRPSQEGENFDAGAE